MKFFLLISLLLSGSSFASDFKVVCRSTSNQLNDAIKELVKSSPDYKVSPPSTSVGMVPTEPGHVSHTSYYHLHTEVCVTVELLN